jgi:hypothetical protein
VVQGVHGQLLGCIEDDVDNSAAGNEELPDIFSDAGTNAWGGGMKSIPGSILW